MSGSDITPRSFGDSLLGAVNHPVFDAVRHPVFDAVRRWSDPRERMLRKQRRVRRRVVRYGVAGGAAAVGAGALAVVGAPVLFVVVSAGGAVALLMPSAAALRTYRRLQSRPLPPPLAARMLPPLGSSARPAMQRLDRAERGLADLMSVLMRKPPVPQEDLDETRDTARSAAAALRALSADVVALERAQKRVPSPHLAESVRVAREHLESGVADYEHLVTTAARLVTPITFTAGPGLPAAVAELREAADKLDAWADAVTDLASG